MYQFRKKYRYQIRTWDLSAKSRRRNIIEFKLFFWLDNNKQKENLGYLGLQTFLIATSINRKKKLEQK